MSQSDLFLEENHVTCLRGIQSNKLSGIVLYFVEFPAWNVSLFKVGPLDFVVSQHAKIHNGITQKPLIRGEQKFTVLKRSFHWLFKNVR